MSYYNPIDNRIPNITQEYNQKPLPRRRRTITLKNRLVKRKIGKTEKNKNKK
jgi:hypothetical protein